MCFGRSLIYLLGFSLVERAVLSIGFLLMAYPALSILISFVFSIALIKILNLMAFRFGLVDSPDARKLHNGQIPLVGGVAIYISIFFACAFHGKWNAELIFYLISSGLLVVVGVVDDYKNISPRSRVVAEIVAACLMVFGAGVSINSFGNILGFGDVPLNSIASPLVTIFAVVALINAINMMDGIDGLAAGVSLISLFSFLWLAGDTSSRVIPAVYFVSSTAAFLIFNLQLMGARFQKVFLGDAGSMLCGFTLVWLIIRFSQSEHFSEPAFKPVTALWIIALPLIDMVCTVIRRLRKNRSPFGADRNHLHHILMYAGLDFRQALFAILLLAGLFNMTGILMLEMRVAESLQFILFIVFFVVYYFAFHKAFRFGNFVRRLIN